MSGGVFYSKFYFVDPVTLNNQFIVFKEVGEVLGTLDIGALTPEDLVNESARAMNEVGSQIYAMVLNRTTRKVTVSAPGAFEVNVNNGSHDQDNIWNTLGFTTNRGAGVSHESDIAMGSEWAPQFPPQKFTPFIDWEDSVDAVKNQAAEGDTEVVSFGDVRFMEADFMFITDLDMGTQSDIKTDLTAVSKARAFLQFMRTVRPMEFMEDAFVPVIFDKILIESTPESKLGTAFKLKKMTSMGLYEHYTTGLLKFREIS